MIGDRELLSYMQELAQLKDIEVKTGKQFSKAQQAYERFQELRKSIMSEIIIELKRDPKQGKTARNLLEDTARSDQRYLDWVNKMADAGKMANELKVEYTAILNRQKALITMISVTKELVKVK